MKIQDALDLHLKEEASRIIGEVYEYDVSCGVCKTQVGYWAHGHWEPIPEMGLD